MKTKAGSDPTHGELPEIPEDISAEIPTPIGLDKSGRIIGLCPEVPEEAEDEVHCWKFEPLPGQETTHDFLLLIFLMELGPLSLLNAVVPLDDGGVKHMVQFTEFRRIVESSLIKKIKLEHGNFGVFSIGKITAKTRYQELESLFVGDRCLIKRFNAKGEPVGDYTEMSPQGFPPFPKGAQRIPAGVNRMDIQSTLPPEEAIRLVGADDYQQGLVLHFPKWEEEGGDLFVKDDEGVGSDIASSASPLDISHLTLDDISGLSDDEIGQGFISIGSEAAEAPASVTGLAAVKTRPPGIHIEFVRHSGDPAHVAALFWFKPLEGRPKFLFGDWCTQVSFRTFIERIKEKKRKSWFGSRKKITKIRKELIVDGVLCKPIP